MLLALIALPQVLERTVFHFGAAPYYLILLALQIWPMLLTYRGSYGHRLHPVNVLFMVMSSMGLVGSASMGAAYMFAGGPFIAILAGALLFMGIIGSAVLAFFATPWRDWGFRQREHAYLQRMQMRSDRRHDRNDRIDRHDRLDRNDRADRHDLRR